MTELLFNINCHKTLIKTDQTIETLINKNRILV